MMANPNGTDRLFSAVTIRAEIAELAKTFQLSNNLTVAITFDLNPGVERRIPAGEAFDVGITNPWYVGDLINSGKVDPDTRVPFGHVPLAIARGSVRPGAVDIESERALQILRMLQFQVDHTERFVPEHSAPAFQSSNFAGRSGNSGNPFHRCSVAAFSTEHYSM